MNKLTQMNTSAITIRTGSAAPKNHNKNQLAAMDTKAKVFACLEIAR